MAEENNTTTTVKVDVDKIAELTAEKNLYMGKYRALLKLVSKTRNKLVHVTDHIEDEGDRRYFGSTNDADDLKSLYDEMMSWIWDATDKTNCMKGDPYAEIRKQRARAEKAEAALLALTASPNQAPAPQARGYQDRVADAHKALFHDDPTDAMERTARFFEEALETCQAVGMTAEDAHKLVDYTFSRPIGEPGKEIGAALLTLTSLCVVAGYDLASLGEAELEKLQRPETIARIRAKRATRHGRGPLPGFDPKAKGEANG